MDIILVCTTNLINNLPEVHHFVLNHLKNNDLNANNTIYTNPLPLIDPPIISFNRKDVIPTDKSIYMHVNENKDIISKHKIASLLPNPKIVNVIFPLDEDIYLGSIIISIKKTNSNNITYKLVNNVNELN
ncbi:hypothetical protein QKU48_gp0960 [Fadolivirus algeromassiliense]|jgi:hypothetical protein|uniref:Uncharacterized protein n=1 Tax=Fadolivirus FV1/VV64 TaxID=3070911 RepID=A0A7D3R2C9_9VIRU|nr:hypothetical protein QKU48_gp0960 [Fadolivirus algeromassiliense]QKF94418.1 hypothetical protein Fadolivirus_1_960 [Fadolivirus FV1/VV64]